MGAPMGAFMRLALVTGQRRTEIATAARQGRLRAVIRRCQQTAERHAEGAF
jgi:hypothetical protein